MKLGAFRATASPAAIAVAERVRRFNPAPVPYPRHSTLHAEFSACAARRGSAPAVRDTATTLTYEALDRASNTLARALISAGVAAEDFVVVLCDTGPSLASALLGTLKAGAAYCPFETDTPDERLERLITMIGCTALVTEPAHREVAERLRAACPLLRTVVYLEGGHAADCQESEAPLPERASAGHLAYVLFTSGTSGTPKGVLVEHRAVLRLVVNNSFVPLDDSTRVLLTGSVAFDAATFEIWGPLLNGGVLMRPGKLAVLDPSTLKRLIREHDINTMWLTSSLFNHIVDADVSALAYLRYLLIGGERLSPPHVDRFRRAHPDAALINGYGPTENTTFSTTYRIAGAIDGDIPIGTPIANSDAWVVDASGAIAAPGVAGEIGVGGDGLARGYWNDAALTAERFRPHPQQAGARIYLTRDRGRWTPAGLLEYLGRMDVQVKIRGHRVEPGEVGARVRACAGVDDAVVVAATAPAGDLALVAYYLGTADASAIRGQLRAELPTYMLPRHVIRMPSFPLTSNGKLDTRALPEPDWHAASAVTAAYETETEAALADIWKELLQVEQVAADDNFFDAGGHSFTLTRLVAAIQQRLGVEVPLAAVFRAQTIRELAQVLVGIAAHGSSLADDTMVPLGAAHGAPVFAFPPGTGDVLSYIPLAARWVAHRLYAFNFIEADTRITDYADLVQSVQPHGPYVLLGYSAGGNLAFHVAGELERRRERVARIVMIDSARMLAPYPFLEDEVRRTIAAFLAHPTIAPYCATPVLRDKIARRISAYYRWLSRVTDSGTIAADIDILLSSDCAAEHVHDGRLITSVAAWSGATRGTVATHRGEGSHIEMLFEPFVEANAVTLSRLLAEATASC